MTLLHQAAQKAVEALESCPFCGGRATVDSQFGREWWVECDDCAASTGGMEATRAAAMVAWNRRAESALQQQPEPAAVYVECRECGECGHAGINDDHPTDAACNSCDWRGPSPKEDHCPGCGEDGTMISACPKCGCGRYTLVADATIAPPALQQQEEPREVALPKTQGVLSRPQSLGEGWRVTALYETEADAKAVVVALMNAGTVPTGPASPSPQDFTLPMGDEGKGADGVAVDGEDQKR